MRPIQPTIAFALAAVLALGLGVVSADEPEVSETVITALETGDNFIGWLGEPISVSDLLDAVVEIELIYAWDAERQQIVMASPFLPKAHWGLRQLKPGQAYAIRAAAPAILETSKVSCQDAELPIVLPGFNLIAWTQCSTELADTFEALGPLVSEILLLGSSVRQAPRQISRGSTSFGHRDRLLHGAPMWVVRPQLEGCLQSTHTNLTYDVPENADPRAVARAALAIEDVIRYFDERYGVRVEALHVKLEDKPYGGWANYEEMSVALGRFYAEQGEIGFIEGVRTIAHEYWHVLQMALSNLQNWPPVWLVEGTAQYMASKYLDDESLSQQEIVLESMAPGLEALDWYGFTGWDYFVGEVASDVLYNRERTAKAFVEFWCKLKGETSWQSAFESAFRLSTDELYASFEDWTKDIPISDHHSEYFQTLPRATIAGNVIRGDGTPIEGARVMADRLVRGPWVITWTSALSDQNGEFELDVVVGCCGETGDNGAFSGYWHVFSVDPFSDGCQRWYGDDGKLVDRAWAQEFHVDKDMDRLRFVLLEGVCD